MSSQEAARHGYCGTARRAKPQLDQDGACSMDIVAAWRAARSWMASFARCALPRAVRRFDGRMLGQVS
eukprot:10596972-Prorocentrum_lima.AAC.1